MIALYSHGHSEFSIVTGEKPSKEVSFAATLLQEQIRQSSGVTLPILPKASGKEIALSESQASGVSIFVSSEKIKLKGFSNRGPINSVIEFLSHFLEFRVFEFGETHIENTEELLLEEGEWNFVPSFEHHLANYGWIRKSERLRYLTRSESAEELFISGNRYHNAFEILRYGGHQIETKFLSEDGKQLCYSHPDLPGIFADRLWEYLHDPSLCDLSRPYMVLGMEDNLSWCHCPRCQAHSPSEAMVLFANQVSSLINERLKQEGAKPKIFFLFAYYHTLIPPKGVRCNPDVGVFFAPIKASFRNPLPSKENEGYGKALKQWSTLTEHLFVWSYSFYTRRNQLLYDSFLAMETNYRFFRENGATLLYDQTESYSDNQTGFCHAKAYVQHALAWNADLSVEALLDEYFHLAFPKSGKEMRLLFTETQHQLAHLNQIHKAPRRDASKEGDEEHYSEIGQVLDRFEDIPKKEIDRFLAFLDDAIQRIDGLKEDSPPNEIERLDRECIQFRFLRLLLSEKIKPKEIDALYRIMREENIAYWKECGKISNKTTFSDIFQRRIL